MGIRLQRLTSSVLIFTLIGDPLTTAAASEFGLPGPVENSIQETARYREEALSLATLSENTFPFRPFTSFWTQLKQTSPASQALRWGSTGIFSLAVFGGLLLHGVPWGHIALYAGAAAGLLAHTPSGEEPAGKPDFIKIEVAKADPSHPNEIMITTYADQPGIIRAFTAFPKKRGVNIAGGTRSEPLEIGAVTHLVLEEHSLSEMETLRTDIRNNLKIPLAKAGPKRKMARYHISALLLNKPGIFNDFLDRISAEIPEMNIIRLSSDPTAPDAEYAWMEMEEIAIPEASKKYGDRTPDEVLQDVLAALQQGESPLIGDYEVSQADVSKATLNEFMRALQKNKIVRKHSWLHRMVTTDSWILTLLGWNGRVDKDVVKWFEHGMKKAEILHAGEQRDSEDHPEYVVHPYSVTVKLIKQGVRDPVYLLAALLHDAMETRAPELVLELIHHEFPGIKHKLEYILDYITNYKTQNYAAYVGKLTAKGGINLLALKLADMEDNLVTIFQVKDDPGYAGRQIAKRIRFGLPIVSWEPTLKNDVYTNSRRDFLRTLIGQSEEVSDEEFLQQYLQPREQKETPAAQQIIDINIFLKWADRNEASLPMDLGKERIDHFKSRLFSLRQWLIKTNGSPPMNLQQPVTLMNFNGTFIEQMGAPEHVVDKTLLDQILYATPTTLDMILHNHPEKVFISPTERAYPEEGRTLYMALDAPLEIANRKIAALRIKSIRPRLNDDGTVRSYPVGSTGYAPYTIVTHPDGSYTKRPNPPEPHGTMTQVSASREIDIMKRLLDVPGVEADIPIGWGRLNFRLHEKEPTAFVIAGLKADDTRLNISLRHLHMVSRRTGERTLLQPEQARQAVTSIALMLRRLHDAGIYHGSVYFANLGVEKRVQGDLAIVLRDFGLSAEKTALGPSFSKTQDAALRFLDLWRLLYDLLVNELDYLVVDFIRAYFQGSHIPPSSLEAAVRQIRERKWITVWSLFRDPQSRLPKLGFGPRDPTLAHFWNCLLVISSGPENKKPDGRETPPSNGGSLPLVIPIWGLLTHHLSFLDFLPFIAAGLAVFIALRWLHKNASRQLFLRSA